MIRNEAVIVEGDETQRHRRIMELVSLKYLKTKIQGIIAEAFGHITDLETRRVIGTLEQRLTGALASFESILEIIDESNLPPAAVEEREKIEQQALRDIPNGFRFFGFETLDAGSIDKTNLVGLARQVFGIPVEQMDDEFLRISILLLSQVRRWRLKDGSFANAVIDNFDESDLFHTVKMVTILNRLAKVLGFSDEEKIFISTVVLLHDLAEAVVSDYSNGELDSNSEASKKFQELFKQIEEMVVDTIPILKLPKYNLHRVMFKNYNSRLANPSQIFNRLFCFVRFLDKLEPLFTVATLETICNNREFFDINGYSQDFEISIPNMWKAFEQYAHSVMEGQNPIINQQDRVSHLTTLLTFVIEETNNRVNDQKLSPKNLV